MINKFSCDMQKCHIINNIYPHYAKMLLLVKQLRQLSQTFIISFEHFCYYKWQKFAQRTVTNKQLLVLSKKTTLKWRKSPLLHFYKATTTKSKRCFCFVFNYLITLRKSILYTRLKPDSSLPYSTNTNNGKLPVSVPIGAS